MNLTPQQRQMVATVRDLAQSEFRNDAIKYMDGTFPWENMRKLAKLGVLGMAVPEEYGGMGLPVFDTALILEEIAKVDYVTAMAVLGEAGVQTRVIATYAPEEIKRRILPKVCTAECILAICMTEPHAGTDVANYRTNATVKGDRVILNGTKTLISRAAEAGMFVIFTRIEGKPGREGIGCVLLEPGTKGFAVTGTYHTMGGENLHEVQFTDCELPLENLVIREDGFRKLLTAFNTQRCLNPAISLGLAEGAFDETVLYVRERHVFGKPLDTKQGVRWKLADMYKDIEAGRGLLYRACASADPFPDPFLSAVAKIFCNDMSIRDTRYSSVKP
jgi:alkylation response protein AidB-like acyl-CoA dehydrogenase